MESEMLDMTKKKWIVTIAVTVAILAALGTTVAFAADGDTEFGRGLGRWFNGDERAPFNYERTPYSEEWLAELVKDGVITQKQADSILAGDARLYDFVDPEDCEEYGMPGENGMYGRGAEAGYMYSEEWLAELVKDGVITQKQADSILAGEARLYDFVDPDDCPALGDGYYADGERGTGRMPRGGRAMAPRVNP